jgi:PhnB protein
MTNSTKEFTGTKGNFSSGIAPWLSLRNAKKALEFYKSAFGAQEVYRLESPEGEIVARLSVGGAEFWISDGNPEAASPDPESLGGGTVRMILTVEHPDEIFRHALQAGAREIFPVGEDHGWRLGRLEDPFGLHWEIGKPLS